jgi:hypothetical protein
MSIVVLSGFGSVPFSDSILHELTAALRAAAGLRTNGAATLPPKSSMMDERKP